MSLGAGVQGAPPAAVPDRAGYVLCFTRADYRQSASGIEKYLTEEVELLAGAGLSAVCVFLFRTRRSRKADAWLSRYWGVVAAGKWRGFIPAAKLADWLAAWGGTAGGLLEIQLHHVQDYPLDLLADFLAAVPAPVRLYVHDYHAVCGQYNLLRNDREFCGPTAPSADKCAGCRSWNDAYYPAMRTFLESLRGRLDVLAPSAAAARVFSGAYPEWAGQVRVVPHWRSAASASAAPGAAAGETLKIGFVGAPSAAKGWDVFVRLSQRSELRRMPIECFHFGQPASDGHSPVRNVPISFVRDGRGAMTAALRGAGVDVVVLWSLWPETYCYVLYECLQAGAMVLTHPDSGNVADKVRRSGVGLVLSDERALQDYLADPPRVRADVARCRPAAWAGFGSMAVNDEILRLIPRTATPLAAAGAAPAPARAVGALHALKMAWRRWGFAR